MVNQGPAEDIRNFMKETDRTRNTPYAGIGLGSNESVKDDTTDERRPTSKQPEQIRQYISRDTGKQHPQVAHLQGAGPL
jgi:hypothetical protein